MKCSRPNCNIFFEESNPNKKHCSNSCTRSHQQIRASARLKKKIFDFFNNKCNHCGFDNPLALQIDHVNSGGKKEVVGKNNFNKTSGLQYYRNVLKVINSGKYQLLCANCNWIKRFTNNE